MHHSFYIEKKNFYCIEDVLCRSESELFSDRYMNFYISNKYFNPEFESMAANWILEITSGRKQELLCPSTFCKLCLCLTYFQRTYASFSSTEYKDLLNAIPQLNNTDIVIVSFILWHIFERFSKKKSAARFLHYYVSTRILINLRNFIKLS